jgi:diadenosine tetraphosphate (Ap4A) HIT family hydrolase
MVTMSTVIHQWEEQCRAGTNPRVIARVNSGWVVLGSNQFLPGYCLLLPDPVVSDLNALAPAARQLLLEEVTVVGDALLALTDAVRINYEILGNLEPALHVHLFPRYADEPEQLRTKPVWFYDWEAAPAFALERDGELMRSIATYLQAHLQAGFTAV